MIRFFLAVLLGGVGLFAVGFGMWGFLPLYVEAKFHPFKNLEKLEKFETVKEALKDVETGVYHYPFMYESKDFWTDEAKQAAFQEKSKSGPLMQVFVQRQGVDGKDPMTMVPGAIHCLIAAFLMGFLVKSAGLDNFFSRWGFVAVAGLLLAVWAPGNAYAWMHMPQEYVQFDAAYTFAAWLVAGFFLAMGTGVNSEEEP